MSNHLCGLKKCLMISCLSEYVVSEVVLGVPTAHLLMFNQPIFKIITFLSLLRLNQNSQIPVLTDSGVSCSTLGAIKFLTISHILFPPRCAALMIHFLLPATSEKLSAYIPYCFSATSKPVLYF